ncbi:PREDICTED: pentatricopeptide repeat-containing protein At4g36680, mitochondrial [Fragaria vesca subsp. vesca]|uniref:pentatricopeptide repeat-containing protein At4g36680, mitochondrial n=1 Tax=Fragaria vesca subsp. vesca TaxID=101020 RepID=UPI0002C36117|nr:PREDICTED: pentatricopeptide repeat-containing protein At4g36680, mitochondrial [Fragaria vesca subsp. vesca]
MSSSISIRHIRRLSTTAAQSSISISKAKSKLRSEHDPDKALEIYSSVSDRYSSPTSSRYTQDIAVRRLAKSHRFADIESFIESHKNDPKIKQEPYLSTLIRSYGRAGMFDHALKTYEQMDQLGTPRSSISFNSLLTACNLSKHFDRVPQFFNEIPIKYNVSPDKVSYGILIKSFCEAGKPEEAIETVRVMEEKGVEVTAVTFTTIFNALYKKGNKEEAEKLWDEMVEKGCEVDVAAYNVKIMYAHVNGSPEDVKALIDEMSGAGLKPDAISYTYLMTCYCRCGMMEEAEKVYKGLETNKLNPNAATFRTLVFYLCKNECFERAYRVFKKSVEMRKIPDFNTLRFLAEGLMKKNMRKEAKGLIRTVKKKFPPNVLNAWKKVEEGLGLVPDELDSSCVPHDDGEEVTSSSTGIDGEKQGPGNRKPWKKPKGKKRFPPNAGNDRKKLDSVTSSVPDNSAKEATG